MSSSRFCSSNPLITGRGLLRGSVSSSFSRTDVSFFQCDGCNACAMKKFYPRARDLFGFTVLYPLFKICSPGQSVCFVDHEV